MPQIKNGPKELNELLEAVYSSCMKKKNDKAICSKESWGAAYNNGWHKDKSGKWKKKKTKMSSGRYKDVLNLLSLKE